MHGHYLKGENNMTLYQEELLAITKEYICNDYTGIMSEMHIALNYTLLGRLTHEEYHRLLNRARNYIIDLDKKGEIPNE